jgi:pimeloyl-ACP methyl ester carboxylesterase
MGGNVASLFAGVRPERVHSIVSIEGLGLGRTQPDQAPDRYRLWLEETRQAIEPRRFPSADRLAQAVRARYPGLSPERALFIARAWSEPRSDGTVVLLGDPRHKRVNPVLYRREEAEHCWRRIKAPYLLMMGERSEFGGRLGGDGTALAFQEFIPQIEFAKITDAGHMMHLEQPERVAAVVESFLDRH